MADRDGPGHSRGSPTFTAAPLLEVALAVEFAPVAEFGATAMSRLAFEWSDEYPEVQEHPPLPTTFPGFSSRAGVLVNVGAPQLRLWLLTSTGDRVVQLQRDRLIVNWRSGSGDVPYPRYHDALRPEFVTDFDRLTTHLRDQQFPAPYVVATEVTYVNRIDPLENASLVGVLRSQAGYEHHLGSPTFTSINQTWPRRHAGEAEGVLTTQTEAGDGRAMLTITARSEITDGLNRDVVLDSIDRCHDDVVSAFVEMTDARWHQTWGKTS